MNRGENDNSTTMFTADDNNLAVDGEEDLAGVPSRSRSVSAAAVMDQMSPSCAADSSSSSSRIKLGTSEAGKSRQGLHLSENSEPSSPTPPTRHRSGASPSASLYEDGSSSLTSSLLPTMFNASSGTAHIQNSLEPALRKGPDGSAGLAFHQSSVDTASSSTSSPWKIPSWASLTQQKVKPNPKYLPGLDALGGVDEQHNLGLNLGHALAKDGNLEYSATTTPDRETAPIDPFVDEGISMSDASDRVGESNTSIASIVSSCIS